MTSEILSAISWLLIGMGAAVSAASVFAAVIGAAPIVTVAFVVIAAILALAGAVASAAGAFYTCKNLWVVGILPALLAFLVPLLVFTLLWLTPAIGLFWPIFMGVMMVLIDAHLNVAIGNISNDLCKDL